MNAVATETLDLRAVPQERWAATLTGYYRDGLTGWMGLEILDLEPGRIVGRVALRDELMRTPGGALHGGALIAIADSFAGWGCLATLPDGVETFVTSEMKANLVAGASQPDALNCVGRMLHGGRTTQVWDVTVARESDGRAVAHFRCTQHLMLGAAS